jgi:hypothetical protein
LPQAPNFNIYEFENLSQQVTILRDLTSNDKQDWVMFDTTFTQTKNDYAIADALMGCKAYCTANKTPWADYDSCSKLFQKAEESQTLLGLNCTVGVWLDQMEIIPVIMRNLISGRVDFLKRDNSSLNLFFTKIYSGLTVEETIRDLEASGHLDLPGANALVTEVKDQTLKARIAENICGILCSIRPVPIKKPLIRSDGPKSIDPHAIAEWHLSGRKRGNYPALLSQINLDLTNLSLRCEVAFVELADRHPLARDFPGKCAMSIDTSGARFTWSREYSPGPKRLTCSGYGGAKKTAAKIIAEANRSMALSYKKPHVFSSPLLVLSALEKNERAAKKLEKQISLKL